MFNRKLISRLMSETLQLFLCPFLRFFHSIPFEFVRDESEFCHFRVQGIVWPTDIGSFHFPYKSWKMKRQKTRCWMLKKKKRKILMDHLMSQLLLSNFRIFPSFWEGVCRYGVCGGLSVIIKINKKLNKPLDLWAKKVCVIIIRIIRLEFQHDVINRLNVMCNVR